MSDDRRDHVRALVVTIAACLVGVAAAVGVNGLVEDLEATSRNAQLAVLAAIVVQLPVYELAFDEWGGAKDVIYVAFMTFLFWFVTMGVLLTSGAQPL